MRRIRGQSIELSAPVARLEIVREFQPPEGKADLGFALDERRLHVLSQTYAFVDVDEYDFILG